MGIRVCLALLHILVLAFAGLRAEDEPQKPKVDTERLKKIEAIRTALREPKGTPESFLKALSDAERMRDQGVASAVQDFLKRPEVRTSPSARALRIATYKALAACLDTRAVDTLLSCAALEGEEDVLFEIGHILGTLDAKQIKTLVSRSLTQGASEELKLRKVLVLGGLGVTGIEILKTFASSATPLQLEGIAVAVVQARKENVATAAEMCEVLRKSTNPAVQIILNNGAPPAEVEPASLGKKPPTPTPRGNGKDVDLIFIVDSSGSMDPKKGTVVSNFENKISQVRKRASTVRVGFATFKGPGDVSPCRYLTYDVDAIQKAFGEVRFANASSGYITGLEWLGRQTWRTGAIRLVVSELDVGSLESVSAEQCQGLLRGWRDYGSVQFAFFIGATQNSDHKQRNNAALGGIEGAYYPTGSGKTSSRWDDWLDGIVAKR